MFSLIITIGLVYAAIMVNHLLQKILIRGFDPLMDTIKSHSKRDL